MTAAQRRSVVEGKADIVFGRTKSLHLLQQLPRLAQQGLNLFSLGDCGLREAAVLARIPVSPGRAAIRRSAVFAAAPFAVHRRCAARFPAAGFGAATPARPHRSGVAGVIAHPSASAAPLSETIKLACCVTLPTMALPPIRMVDGNTTRREL